MDDVESCQTCRGMNHHGMPCLLLDLYKIMTIGVYDMQLKSTKPQCVLWMRLNQVRLNQDKTQHDPRKIKVITKLFDSYICVQCSSIYWTNKVIYKNYVKGYFHITIPLFDLTKRNVVLNWNLNYHNVLNLLKHSLVLTLILVRPNFLNAFILDVDLSICGVGTFLQKDGINE